MNYMEFGPELLIIVCAVMAFFSVNWAYFKILKIAKDKNLVDNPDARKLQKTPIPVLGGIAVFFGVISGMLTAAVMVGGFEDVESTSYLLPVMMAMCVMLYVGAMDDIVGLTPISRLVIEILTVLGLIYGGNGCVDSLHGVFGIDTFSWWWGVPLTVFGGVGIINAVNMIDGVNGLSSGLCMVISLLFGVSFYWIGDYSNAMLAFVMFASLLPFYVHNVFGNRSRMFIGDAGTMVMGVLTVWFSITILKGDEVASKFSMLPGAGLLAMTLSFLCVPVFDTLRVMTMRMIHGRSPFSADKTHLHHVFISAGISHFVTSSTIIMLALVIVAIWSMSVKMGLDATMQLIVVIASGVLLVWGTYGFIRYHELHDTKFIHWLSSHSYVTHLGNKEWWKAISRWLDAPENDDMQLLDEERKTHLEHKFGLFKRSSKK